MASLAHEFKVALEAENSEFISQCYPEDGLLATDDGIFIGKKGRFHKVPACKCLVLCS